jgi:glycosyltransferase involved in cell wall biosynthesis
MELSIVMPCLNEVRTLPACITKALGFLRTHGVEGEVIVADNGSTDGSRELARSLGARVVEVPIRGYGAALAAGIEEARGRYVVMGDSDDSYDFTGLLPFLEKLREGYQLVMGNRFRGGIAPGAMPPMHRYFGNPLLSAIGRFFFGCHNVRDLYCGLRGFDRESIRSLALQSDGMEYALEMVIKSHLRGMRVTEVPTTLVPDGRDRAPHLRRYRDGWRSLRFYLVMSPRYFFVAPGLVMMLIGLVGCAALFRGPVVVGGVKFDYHTMAYAAALVSLGFQSVMLGAFAKLVAIETGLHPPKTRLGFLQRRDAMENLFIAGLVMFIAGLVFGIVATEYWRKTDFGDIRDPSAIRWVTLSILSLTMGGQTFMAGGLFGVIRMLVDRRHQIARGSRSPLLTQAESPATAKEQ